MYLQGGPRTQDRKWKTFLGGVDKIFCTVKIISTPGRDRGEDGGEGGAPISLLISFILQQVNILLRKTRLELQTK